jgi:RNA recognition motif-containing protein
MISKPPADYDESKTLFVCALPQTATKEKIERLFSASAQHIVDIRLKLDHDKNYAYVEFDTQENKDSAFSEAHH